MLYIIVKPNKKRNKRQLLNGTTNQIKRRGRLLIYRLNKIKLQILFIIVLAIHFEKQKPGA